MCQARCLNPHMRKPCKISIDITLLLRVVKWCTVRKVNLTTVIQLLSNEPRHQSPIPLGARWRYHTFPELLWWNSGRADIRSTRARHGTAPKTALCQLTAQPGFHPNAACEIQPGEFLQFIHRNEGCAFVHFYNSHILYLSSENATNTYLTINYE